MSTIIPTSSVPSMGSSKHSGKTVKLKTFLQSKGTLSSPGKRTLLQQLQPSAGDGDKLVGKDGFIRSQKPRTPKRKRDGDRERPSKKQFITKPTKQFSIFQDQKLSTKSDSSKTQQKEKTPEEIAYELMVQEDVPEKYWEELAEERREALEQTLEENEQLHTEVKELKEENTKLKVTADQAVYLAGVVQELLGEGGDDDDDESDQSYNLSEASVSRDCDDECNVRPVSGDGVDNVRGLNNEMAEDRSDSDIVKGEDRITSDSAQDTDEDVGAGEWQAVQDRGLIASSLESEGILANESEEDKENTETESDEDDRI